MYVLGEEERRSGATLQECKSARVQGYKSARVQEYKSTRVQKYKSARVQECKSTRLLSGVGSGERANLKKKDTANNKPWKAGSGSVEERARGITERSRPRKWISLVRDQLIDFAGEPRFAGELLPRPKWACCSGLVGAVLTGRPRRGKSKYRPSVSREETLCVLITISSPRYSVYSKAVCRYRAVMCGNAVMR
ncbi:hypothetical protein PAAG_12451 [Paracoccidioides lutzii Pb01]|uniref:Uncharacterized protein n=1 Tax=Paracoccidioides lutzii (strain ATCC MYA-826 / Pb01) TaxID=502779 RepID=A0A0A2V025_PARBA|nr:hypothetical protein PAAG_12451 [Paracoccidioides lutzii Pb01]KGQ00863.1 hypothetical protein PAAG_12451 [Paracoccidioides lutzii Pb01]